MFTRKTLQNEVNEQMLILHGLLERHTGVAVGIPPIKYRLRGETAGTYDPFNPQIDFNMPLLEHYTDQFIRTTVRHEFAHHGVRILHGHVQFAHGQHWQSLMKLFDAPPRVTHDYDVSVIKTKKSMGIAAHAS